MAAATLRYLALGDSYTIGEGIAAADRWPVQLARVLRQARVPLGEPRVIARTGWTTDELAAAIDAAAPASDHDLVSLLVGVNNQYRGRPVEQFAREFDALLLRAAGFARGDARRVLVLAIPDWGVTPFAAGRDRQAIAAAIDAHNGAVRSACGRRGVAFVDITPVSRARGAEPAMLADDGLHPSAAMHALWARQALPVARRLLAGARA
jgi:lysophospholipase L1-like esterase